MIDGLVEGLKRNGQRAIRSLVDMVRSDFTSDCTSRRAADIEAQVKCLQETNDLLVA